MIIFLATDLSDKIDYIDSIVSAFEEKYPESKDDYVLVVENKNSITVKSFIREQIDMLCAQLGSSPKEIMMTLAEDHNMKFNG